jgi:hypothetical protein
VQQREPIMWVNASQANYRGAERSKMVNGRKVTERVPARGFDGDPDAKRPARGVRSVRLVRHEGHIVDMVLTNGAAHLDPNTEWGQYQKAKARFMGWFPLGSCPCALLTTGEMTADHMVDRATARELPCAPGSYSEQAPCKHALAEIDARRAQCLVDTKDREHTFRDAGERQIDAIGKQTEAIVQAVGDALGNKAKSKVTP